MSEEYVKYWGLTQHPFLLAPDGNMMCVTGQYFECFERLKYAISTNKGGAIIASEDPGLGKTTILLKLIEEMKEEYGNNFRYAYVDHPTLTASQMVEQITGAVTGQMPSEDKLKNLLMLKDALIESKREGGRNIIVIDEGQMLCESRDVLQELRILINLTHNGEYLHTFIFSGQKLLWDTLQRVPEFWQRLPVRYYFTPLRFEETRELIRYRLNRAGLDVAREIFTDEALEMIHKYSQGLPRTIVAVSDLALLNGFTDRTRKVGFKEVTKAINAMGGKGDSLSYTVYDRAEEGRGTPTRPVSQSWRPTSSNAKTTERPVGIHDVVSSSMFSKYIRPAILAGIILFLVFLGALGHNILFSSKEPKTTGTPVSIPVPAKTGPETATALPENLNKQQQASSDEAEETREETTPETFKIQVPTEKNTINASQNDQNKSQNERHVVVDVDAANVRTAPSLEAQRILTIVRGETLIVVDEKIGPEGTKWYKVLLHNNREGWISSTVASLTTL